MPSDVEATNVAGVFDRENFGIQIRGSYYLVVFAIIVVELLSFCGCFGIGSSSFLPIWTSNLVFCYIIFRRCFDFESFRLEGNVYFSLCFNKRIVDTSLFYYGEGFNFACLIVEHGNRFVSIRPQSTLCRGLKVTRFVSVDMIWRGFTLRVPMV